ncbi:transmembrane protein 56 [Stylonychia lemnae]|uniref:Transmembrane protein 56 n=1 Tax=Stylonychia lemnae TaxID=5949 RepID=A0A078A524_STYLE|nr:transmembrane protein 56 [Stylonychia lemnae]|eukprot:CDW75829.1 transmembrane protein 56 [Stylonychia lemnae]
MTPAVDSKQTQQLYNSWRDLPWDKDFAIYILQVLLASLAFWAFMYFYGCYHHPIPKYYKSKMSVQDQFIWRFRVINCYHGAAATLLSLYWHLINYTTECSRQITTFELIMLANTCCHLLMDGLFMYVNGFLDTGNLIHHFFGISGYFACAYHQHNFTQMAMHLLPAEFSNVSMHMREILKRMGMRYTKTYYLNDYAYYIEYIICRALWIPAVFYFFATCATTSPAHMIIYPLHVLMSWYYVSNIPPLMISRYKEMKKIEKAGMKLEWIKPLDSEELKKQGIVSTERFHT